MVVVVVVVARFSSSYGQRLINSITSIYCNCDAYRAVSETIQKGGPSFLERFAVPIHTKAHRTGSTVESTIHTCIHKYIHEEIIGWNSTFSRTALHHTVHFWLHQGKALSALGSV